MNPVHICNFLWDKWNSSESDAGSKRPTTAEGVRYASFVIYIVTCFLGLIGNSIVILIISCTMKNVKTMTWFLNLAVADLMFLACLPLRATSLFRGQWDFGGGLCKVYHFLSNVNMYVSIFILMALSIDRCFSVALPLWHRNCGSKHYIRWVCLMVWIVTTVISLPGLWFSDVETIEHTTRCSIGFYTNKQFNVHNLFLDSSECLPKIPESPIVPFTIIEETMQEFWRQIDLLFRSGKFGDLSLPREGCHNESVRQFFNQCFNEHELGKWNTMLSHAELLFIPVLTVGFLIPLIIITFCNIIIAIKAKHSLKETSSKLYKVVLAMVATYFLAWTPLALVETASLIAARRMDLHLMYSLVTVLPLVSSIACLHSCLNPILYVLLSKRVKSNLFMSWSNLRKSIFGGSDNSSQRHGTKSAVPSLLDQH